MGLLHKLFGGGTQLELKLDTEKVAPGGTVAGSVTLTGGKKPLKLTALKVDIVYIHVEAREDQALPAIDLRVLASNVVAQERDLPPGAPSKYEFRIKLPDDAKPDGTYKVQASADIPGVKDPSADATLTVVGRPSGVLAGLKSALGMAAGEDEVLARYPGLTSRDTDELSDALHQLQCDAYDRDNNFTGVHTFLLRLVEQHDDDDIRRAALAAWGTVLDDRARAEHIRALEALAGRDLPEALMEEVVSVAAKFAEEGALPLVQRLARHPAAGVRRRLATALYLDAARDLAGRRELIVGLCQDADPGVRAAAFGACASLVEDPEIVRWVAACAGHDPSPEVQSACLSAISLGHHYGSLDVVLNTYLEHAQRNPHADARKQVAESLHWLPADERLTRVVGILFSDGSAEVRRALAWQGCNMGEHPELRDMYLHVATSDPDESVRADALRGVPNFLDLPAAVSFLRQRLAVDRNESAYWAALNAVESHLPAPEARALLQEIARGPFSSAAGRAREALAGG